MKEKHSHQTNKSGRSDVLERENKAFTASEHEMDADKAIVGEFVSKTQQSIK